MTKKALCDAEEVWREALLGFVDELHEHVEQAKKDQLRFQDGRLLRSLVRHIKSKTRRGEAKATGRDEWLVLFAYYQFMTHPSQLLGYDEARRLHGEELEARGLVSASEFCFWMPRRFAEASGGLVRKELYSRVRSMASWMEAQTSFSLWLVFKDLRPAWRGSSMDKRARALQALYLSQLPRRCLVRTEHRCMEVLTARFSEGVRIGTNYEGRPWTDREWQKILEQAARLTEKRYDCTDLEKWVWWCYPVFRRFGWNTREVQEAAILRGFTLATGLHEANFRRRLMSMGLRLSGRKQTRRARAPLAEFASHVVLPDPENMWGAVGGFLTKKK